MKNYLVIGSTAGIGKQIALQLASSGHKVYGTYNKTNPENQIENITFHPLNILDENLDFSFLSEQLDGLVYLPGAINLKPFARAKADDYMQDFNLQVIGAVKVIQAVLPKLKNVAESSIVLFSTVAVQIGFNYHSIVSISKGAIEGLTKSLAAEFAPKIRVNCIAPSITDTPLASSLLNSDEKKLTNANRHPLKKIGTPQDIAYLAEFLLSEKSSWITGQIHAIDGGISTIKI